MFKKLVVLLLLCSVLFSFNRAQAFSYDQQKIDPLFLGEVKNTEEWIPVLIELKDDPGITWWSNARSFLMRSNRHDFSSSLSEQDKMFHFIEPYEQSLRSRQANFLRKITAEGIRFIPRHQISLTINAISGEVLGTDLPRLEQFRQISYIYDDRYEVLPMRQRMSRSTGAEIAWRGFDDGSLPNATGRGQLIGIIDSGLFRGHPDFTRPRKVLGGYDFADGNNDFGDYMGHGTHVAGIAAGYGSENHKGMAYEASLMIYKVFSSRRQGARISDVQAAIDRSVEDKCDVINLSLGSIHEFPAVGTTSYHKSIANANKAGVFVVSSAGNSGSRRPEIPWASGPPANVKEAFSVGATNDRFEDVFLTVFPGLENEKKILGAHAPPTRRLTSEMFSNGLVDAGYGRVQDFDLDDDDVRGKVALIKRGPLPNAITFREKVENATRNGALGVVLYNHTPGELMVPGLMGQGETPDQLSHLVPTIMLTLEDGNYLINNIEYFPSINIEYKNVTIMADFSSMGPTPDGVFKPEISAPGHDIISAYGSSNYASMGGTSMSSPSVAGLAALLKEVHPEWNHDQIKSAFMNTAEIAFNRFNHLPKTFLLQGAGTARIEKAVKTPAFIYPRALILHEVAQIEDRTFTVTNAKSTRQQFEISFELFLLKGETSPIEAVFCNNQLSIDGSKEESFTVSFEIDRNKMNRNIYEAVIRLGDELHIPLVFFKNDLTVDDPLSSIYMSNQKLDLTPDSHLVNDQFISIYFTFNTGTLLTASSQGETVYIGRNYGAVEISIEDSEGENWEHIATLNNISPGPYVVEWNGRNQYGSFFLPKGDFQIVIRMEKRVLRNDQWVPDEYYRVTQNFEVIDSLVPPPANAVFSTLKTYREFEDFELDINFGDLSQHEGIDANIERIEFELNYDSSRIMYRRHTLAGFLARNRDDLFFDIDVDDYEGWVKINIEFYDMPLHEFLDERSIVLTFRTISTGRANFTGRNFRVVLSNGDYIRVRPSNPSVRITNRQFLHADINNDRIVDRHDFEIFLKSFGSRYGDENYDPRCDFNQDMKVGILDLMIIAEEMGSFY